MAYRLLDLYCKQGGAAEGYHRAGFEVVGVDIEPQPRYPFEFIQADALTVPLDGFDAIHASPVCKGHTPLRVLWGREWPDLITPTRLRLAAAGVPWVIENVPHAPMRADLILCGCMFGLNLKRHRWFEASWPLSPFPPFACGHEWQGGRPVGVYGHTGGGGTSSGNHGFTKAQWVEAMGIDWMTRDGLAQAIPPAYTEWIGRQLIAHLEERQWRVNHETVRSRHPDLPGPGRHRRGLPGGLAA